MTGAPSRAALLALAVAVVLSACGDDGQPAPPAAATPPTEAPPVSTPVSAPAATSSTVAPPTTAPSPSTTVPTSPTTTRLEETTTTESGPLRVEVSVSDGVISIFSSPTVAEGEELVVVERGAAIELVVTTDVTDEVHVHGYDYKADVSPETPAVITFVADLPGIFEVELEDAGLLLLELEVR